MEADEFGPTVNEFTLPIGFRRDVVERVVLVSEMDGVAEELLDSGGSPVRVLSRVIERCVKSVGDKGWKPTVSDVMSLTIVDLFFLIIAIRRVSLGDGYSVKVKCPSCSVDNTFLIDLSKIDSTEGQVKSEVVLPRTGRKVQLHAMTGHDEVWIEEAMSVVGSGHAMSISLLARIDSIDGESLDKTLGSDGLVSGLLEKVALLPLMDRNLLRKEIGKEPSMDLSIELACSSCKEVLVAELKLDPKSFFFQ